MLSNYGYMCKGTKKNHESTALAENLEGKKVKASLFSPQTKVHLGY